MNSQQLYLAIGIPTLVGIVNTGVLITLILHFANRADRQVAKLNDQIVKLGEDYTRFYGEQRKQQEAIDILKQKVF